MSWYTTYYLCYQKPDGKVYPLGPFDDKGKFRYVRSTSASFTSDLKEYFRPLNEEYYSNELIQAIFNKINYDISYEDLADWEKQLEVLPLKELPNGSYVKTGYFLIDDIRRYISNWDDTYELFFDHMDTTEYSMRLMNELILGKPDPIKDCEGEEIEVRSCRDYAFFSYPDYCCKEYDAFLLRVCAESFEYAINDDETIVVIKTEG